MPGKGVIVSTASRASRRVLGSIMMVVLIFSTEIFLDSPTAAAASCSGASCAGKDPEKAGCLDGARTIGAMDVQGRGMLELRYSPVCKANWGRFSSYWRADAFGAISEGTSYARVTAWNPGGPSQGLASWRQGLGASWWSRMVDGNKKACTGVELFASSPTPGGTSRTNDSLGWTWGPCG